MEQLGIDMDQLISGVEETVRAYRAPADDPSFYGVKIEVRSYLRTFSIDEPFFFAVETGDQAHEPATFVLGVGNDVKRVTIEARKPS